MDLALLSRPSHWIRPTTTRRSRPSARSARPSTGRSTAARGRTSDGDGDGTDEALRVAKQAGSCGAIITGLDLRNPISDELYELLHAELLEHLVICIAAKPAMSPEDQVAFAGRWGVIEPILRGAGRGSPGDDPDLRPEPADPDLARRLHLQHEASVYQFPWLAVPALRR